MQKELESLLNEHYIINDDRLFFEENEISLELAKEMLKDHFPLECAKSLVEYVEFDLEYYINMAEEYKGKHYSLEDYAEELIDEGYYGENLEHIKRYINWELMARDLTYDYVELGEGFEIKYIFRRV